MAEVRFRLVLFLIAMLAGIGQVTNTIYVPAMSMIANDLSANPSSVQAVIGMYLISYGASQFIYGPLSDYFGRRPLVLIGISIFCLGSILAFSAQVFWCLLLGSFIQGCGIGVAGVMARTVARDIYTGRQLHTASSYMSIALIVAPLVGPFLGGVLSTFWGWRANFEFLFVMGLAVLVCEYSYFPETNRHVRSAQTQLKYAMLGFKTILCNTQFQGYMMCLLVTFAGVAVFEAVGGLLFGRVLHYSPLVVSLLFITPLPGFLLGSYLAAQLNKKLSMNQIMLLGITMLAAGAFSMLWLALLGHITVIAILLPATLYLFGGGILFPTATAGALEPFGDSAGKAGALLGGIQNIGAALCTFVSATLPVKSQLPLACILSVLTLMVASVFFKVVFVPVGLGGASVVDE